MIHKTVVVSDTLNDFVSDQGAVLFVYEPDDRLVNSTFNFGRDWFIWKLGLDILSTSSSERNNLHWKHF